MCSEVHEPFRSLTIYEGWLFIDDVYYSGSEATKSRTCSASSDGHSASHETQPAGVSVPHVPAPCTNSSSWKPRYCMFVRELRMFFHYENERQKQLGLERLCRTMTVRSRLQSPMAQNETLVERDDACTNVQCSQVRLDGSVEQFAGFWRLPLSRLHDDHGERERIAFGEVLLSGADGNSKSLTLGNDRSNALKTTSRASVARRSLPHKFKHSRGAERIDGSLTQSKLAESVDQLHRVVDAESDSDADCEVRSVAPVNERSRRPSTGLGFRYYLEQLKHSLSLGKVSRKPHDLRAEHARFPHVASCNELDRRSATITPTPTPTLTFGNSNGKPRTLATTAGLRQLELEREFGPLVEQDAGSLATLPTPSDTSSPADCDGLQFVAAVPCDRPKPELERCSVDSCSSVCSAESPSAVAVNVQCVGNAHPSILPPDCCFSLQLHTASDSGDRLDADEPSNVSRTVYLAMQSREEQRNWLAALRARAESDTQDLSSARRDCTVVRTERCLKLSVMELRNVPRKKRYYCEVYLDSLLHARTGVRTFDDELLFCQLFEFNGLPCYSAAHVLVMRESGGTGKRKSRFVSVLSGSRCNSRVGRCSIELSKLTARGNGDLEQWYALEQRADSSGKKCLPELRVKARYQVLDILSRDCYTELVQLLCNDYVALVSLLEPIVSVRFKDELAVALVGVMHHLHCAQRFLVDVIVHDVRSLNDAEMTFRGNSVATKATEAYLKLVGQEYLRDTLGGFVKELLESDEDCEVDEKKASTAEENCKRLEKWCTTVCERIGRSFERVPVELQTVLTELRRELVALNKAALVDNLISSCIFLRFLCPAILSPSLFGLTSEYPSHTMNRNLTLITKVVQTLVNGTEFGAKEPYMCCMNRFLAQNRNLLREFVRHVSGCDDSQARLAPASELLVDVDKELATVHALLANGLAVIDENSLRRVSQNPVQFNLLSRLRTVVSRISDSLRVSNRRNNFPAKHAGSLPLQPAIPEEEQEPSSCTVARLGSHTQSVPSFSALQSPSVQQTSNNGSMSSRPREQQLLKQCPRTSVYDNVPSAGRSPDDPALQAEVNANWARIVREAEAASWSSPLLTPLPQQEPSVMELRMRSSQQSINQSSALLDSCLTAAPEPRCDLQAPASLARPREDLSGRIYATQSMPTVQLVDADTKRELYIVTPANQTRLDASRIRDSTAQFAGQSSSNGSLRLLSTPVFSHSRRNRLGSADFAEAEHSQSTVTSGYQSLRSQHSAKPDDRALTTVSSSTTLAQRPNGFSNVSVFHTPHDSPPTHRAIAVIQPQSTTTPVRYTASCSQVTVAFAASPHSSANSPSPPSTIGRTCPPTSYVTLVNIATGSESPPSRPHPRRPAPPPPTVSPLAVDSVASHTSSISFRSPLPSASNKRAFVALRHGVVLDCAEADGKPPQLDTLTKQLEEIRMQIDRLQSTDTATFQVLADWGSRTQELLRLLALQQLEKRSKVDALTQQLSQFERAVLQLQLSQTASAAPAPASAPASTHLTSTQTYTSCILRPTGLQAGSIADTCVRQLRDSVDLTLSQLHTFLQDK